MLLLPQVTVQNTQMVYADIGPSSFKKNQNLTPISLELDDSHVEYSQIKHNTDAQKSQVMINEEPDGIILLSIQMAIIIVVML